MEGLLFLLKHKIEFAVLLLLICYWPDLSHMATLIARESGKCSLWQGPCVQLKSGAKSGEQSLGDSLTIKQGENPRFPRTIVLFTTSGLSSVNQQTRGWWL